MHLWMHTVQKKIAKKKESMCGLLPSLFFLSRIFLTPNESTFPSIFQER